MAVCTEEDFGWFESRDGWREVWGPPKTMQSLIFRILRGCNDARVDLHHQAARERDLDYHIARNIVEAFLASGWTPPAGAGTSIAHLLGRAAPGLEPEAVPISGSLRQFAARRSDLAPGDIEMLARIRFRGDRPQRMEDWEFLWQAIKQAMKR
jgi:hypothetical protein